MGLNEIDMIFKLSALDEHMDVNDLSQSNYVWLIPQGFSGIIILGVGPIICIVI